MLRSAARFKICECSDRGVAIPRTDILANIAAEDMPPHGFAQLCRNRATQFNREIRDAAARVENVGLDNGGGRARIDAQTAIPTKISRRSSGRAERLRQIERRYDYPKERPRPRFFVDETRVLRQPSEPRVFCRNSFDDRAGIYIGARFKWF